MSWHRRRRESSLDLSLAPFIDVVFLLLCFFVVTTRFDYVNSQSIELPRTHIEHNLVEREFVDIVLLRSGRVIIGNNEFSSAEDAAIATTLHQLHTDQPVLIKADINSRHGDVITLMDTAIQAGFSSINIASVDKEQ